MDLLRAKWLLWVGALGGLLLWIGLVRLSTPTHLTLLTGLEGSTSYQDALQYETLLEKRGLEVEVEATDGAAENLIRLARGTAVEATFAELSLERAIGEPELVEELYSLGSLYVSPIWVFTRKEGLGQEMRDLEGRKLVLGASGSATRVMAEQLLKVNGVEHLAETQEFDELEVGAAARALAEGRVDAMFVLGEPDSPAISGLLRDPALQARSFRRAEAYARRYDTLVELAIPEGALDLESNIPAEELQLLGVPVQLVVPRGMHPAIVELLLEASSRVHRSATLFTERGEYPREEPVSLPLAPQAERFFEEGGPKFLQAHLPFWLASWLHRTALILVGLFGATMALAQVIPLLVSLRFSRPMNLLYGRLEEIERSWSRGRLDREAALAELESIEQESLLLKTPLGSMRAPFFEFRQNVHDLRDRLQG